jgi:cytosine/adenosine deaminase-related metal-dependent hydrolase
VILRARWVLPIEAPPIENAWVRAGGGVIREIGRGRPTEAHDDLGDAAILPGLVNAHTHLELSWMKGLNPPSASMDQWIRRLMSLRKTSSPPAAEQAAAAQRALEEARALGTLAFGDISNTLITAGVLAAAAVPAVLFHELLGFAPHDYAARARDGANAVQDAAAGQVRAGIAPHAPYSTAPELFQAIAREAAARSLPMSVHLGESPEEIEFLMTGTGAIAEMLRSMGVWRDDWKAPGCDPATYLDRLGVLTPGMLAVHCTQLKPYALATLAARKCVIVSCPGANRWIGNGAPPLDDFYASGCAVAFGTDSLASAGALDMFAELSLARAISTVSNARLLESATRGGAIALGLEESYGRIAPGARTPLLAVQVPAGTTDVEQYLVSGTPREMQWVG